MTSSNHQSPESESATPENSTTAEPQQSGFTAVNGRSPSNSSNPTQDSPEQVKQPNGHADANLSSSSPSKRKDSHEALSPADEQHVQKKQHTSDAQEPTGATISQPQSASPVQDVSRANLESSSERTTTSELPWQMHEHSGSISSEAHLAEVLQSNMPPQQATPIDSSPDQRYHLGHTQHSPYQVVGAPIHSPPGMSAAQMQKQRKRNFSNRTKTGCLTCRERKKKCDEGKPACSNCQRGGFFCKGYVATGNPHYKTSIPRDQPPLQAKNGYFEPHFRGYPIPAPPYYEQPQPDGLRPMPVEEPPRTIPPPQEPNLRGAYGPQQQWPDQPMPGHLPRPEYQQMPPIRDLSQSQKQAAHPPPAPVHPPHNRSLSQHGPQNGQVPQYPRSQSGQYDQRMMAQSALDHPSSQQPFQQLSEKAKMLKGMPFDRKDAKLKQERYDCAQAIYRFNKNAIEPGNLSEPSRREQFRQIIEGSKGDGSPNNRKRRSPSPHQGERVTGHLGMRVEVEAPFFCEYGYNIHIGDDVEIGPNCRIMDSCHVEIGARCIIGPDVKILALDYDHFSAVPPGKKRAAKANRIVIGEDVFLGAGAIILPGISIHKGATVGAGCVVSRDVKHYLIYV